MLFIILIHFQELLNALLIDRYIDWLDRKKKFNNFIGHWLGCMMSIVQRKLLIIVVEQKNENQNEQSLEFWFTEYHLFLDAYLKRFEKVKMKENTHFGWLCCCYCDGKTWHQWKWHNDILPCQQHLFIFQLKDSPLFIRPFSKSLESSKKSTMKCSSLSLKCYAQKT